MEKELLESGFITSLGILQRSWTTILYPSVFPQIVHTSPLLLAIEGFGREVCQSAGQESGE
jgi:hypothetical protein